MKTASSFIAAVALAAVGTLPAHAAVERKRADAMVMPSSAVHTGAATYEDHQLASDVVAAISADPSLSGTTVTVVVKDGHITLSGSAKDVAQAARAEAIARTITGRAVEGRLDVQGG